MKRMMMYSLAVLPEPAGGSQKMPPPCGHTHPLETSKSSIGNNLSYKLVTLCHDPKNLSTNVIHLILNTGREIVASFFFNGRRRPLQLLLVRLIFQL